MVWLTEARLPQGMRVYAIGDVHGCLDQLSRLHEEIYADLTNRPVDDWRIVHIGDYADRGPDSRGVIELLLERTAGDGRILCLRGNHDEMFARGIRGDRRMAQVWLNNGGLETLQSYGLDLEAFLAALQNEGSVEDAIPAEHLRFLDELGNAVLFGDYYFVHAGIDPTRPLDYQEHQAQLWIREPFLTSRQEFEAVVVHGHTPVRQVEARDNRIGIDTGAVYGGRLSCLVLEGARKELLVEGRIAPLAPAGAGMPTWPDREADEEAPRSLARSILSRLPLRFGRSR